LNSNCKAAEIRIERLARQALRSDRAAFDELVRLCQRRAMLVALRILSDENEAAEAVQDGFLKAFLNIKKLREPAKFEMWLLKIITNTAVSRLRKLKRRPKRLPLTDCTEDTNARPASENNMAEELKNVIQQAMTKLSKKQAKAIALFGLDGLSQKQVAEIMDLSEPAVRWHVFKAREKMKVLLKDYIK
jgi:RNA polymerase sigma-70 factor (ECF subfamily)